MANNPWQPGYVLEGRYELIKLVGEGGMGVVWRVFDREWGRDLALKLPRPLVLENSVLRERFVREAETWIGLGVHPHIVQCWFVTEVHGIPALFLDYLTGGSLKSWIDNGHVRPGLWNLIVEIAMQVAEGLAYAHSRGVIHRDVKPENLLIRGDERVCVTDFGLVKTAGPTQSPTGSSGIRDESSENAGMTGTGAYLGTPMYGAPEQWGAAERVGPPADLYALGVTIYEMCCGRRPFDTNDEPVAPLALIQRHLKEKPPDPREFHPNVPTELARLCLLMLSKDPAQRPAHMMAVRESLGNIHQKLSGRKFRAPAPLLSAKSPDVLNNQAFSLSSLGKLTQAVEILRQGLHLDPGHPECLYNLVQLEKRHGRIGHLEALRRLKQARALYPLALLYIEEGMPADAYDTLRAINTNDLSSPGLLHRATGDALMYLGHYPAAERSYAQAHELMPKDATTAQRRMLAGSAGRAPDGAIHFPSSEPLLLERSSDRTLRLILDDQAQGLIGLTQSVAVYLGLESKEASVEEERPAVAGPVTQTWISGKRLAIADSKGFECRLVPSMRLLTRRQGRILACSPQIHRMVTLEQAGPQLFVVEKGQFEPIQMDGQSPDQGPLLAGYDPSGQQLGLLLPSGHLAGIDSSYRAIVQPWPSHVDGHKEARCLSLTADGAVIIGFSNGALRCYNLHTRQIEFNERFPEAPSSIEVKAGRIIVRTVRGGFLILSRTGDVLLSGEGPLAIDPQGRRALFFFQGRQVLYSLYPLHVLRRWSRVMENPKSVAFSGDGRLAVSLSVEGEYLVWEIDEPHRVYQRELLMSPGRNYADILHADEQFQRNLELARQALAHGEPLESNRHLQRARKVPGYGQGAAALDFAWLLLERLKRDQLEAVWERLSIEGSHLGDLDLAPEGRQILFSFGASASLAQDQDGAARPVWTVSRKGLVRLLRFVQVGEHRAILIADESGEMGLHSISDGRLKQVFPVGPLAHAVLHGTTVTYLCRGGGLGQWDLSEGTHVLRDDVKATPRVFAPWQRDKILIATASSWGILDLKRPGSKLQALRLGVEITKVPNFIENLADRGLLVLGFTSGTLRVLEIPSGRVLAALKHGEGNRVTSFELLSELGVALTATSRGQIYIWDLRNEQLLDRFVAHRNGITSLRSSCHGRYLLTGGNDGMVRYWETSWSAGEVRGGDGEVTWLSKGKKGLGKLLGRSTPSAP